MSANPRQIDRRTMGASPLQAASRPLREVTKRLVESTTESNLEAFQPPTLMNVPERPINVGHCQA
jgi:hypothetical protein